MKLADLDLRDLFDFSPSGGVMRFAGERALILDAVALGLLRRTLIETLGLNGARSILTQFGYAHGHRTAMTMKNAFPWDTEREWRIAGGRLHQLQGLVRPEPVPGSQEFVEDIWRDSYEAEQHLMHVGRSDVPVCWSQVGFATGYISYTNGREIYAVETRCRARGDAVCHMIARPREAWGDALAAHLPFYAKASLDAALAHAAEELKKTERRLRTRKHQLASFRADPDERTVTARSPAMRKVLALAERVARVDSTVLITGESGGGKERVARLIHEHSERAARTLVAIHCGALPCTPPGRELFGNGKGYWDFFSPSGAPGLLQVWGFATVTRSGALGIAEGAGF